MSRGENLGCKEGGRGRKMERMCSEQEVTHEETERQEQFKKGDKNNNGMGRDSMDPHRGCQGK